MNRSRTFVRASAIGALVVAIAACGSDDDLAADDATTTAAPTQETVTTDAAPTTNEPETITTAEPAPEPEPTTESADPSTTATTSEPEPELAAGSTCPEPTPNDATQPAGIVAALDPAAGEYLEGITVDRSGNIYVTLIEQGRILRFAPGSSDYEVFGEIPDWEFAGTGFLGLAVDHVGNIYGAVDSGASTGVWKFDCTTGAATRFAGTEDITIPNALTFDDQGNLYLTDSWSNGDEAAPLGAIWRIDPTGTVEKWLENDTLAGTGAFGLGSPFGANGIAYRGGTLYVAVVEKMSIVAIPILDDDTPGEIGTIVEGGVIPDGIALDAEGRIYVADVGGSAIKRVSLDGTIEVLAEGAPAGLDLPASLAFGVDGTELTLYATNLANIEAFSTGVGPAVVAVDVDTPGLLSLG
jgi:sugar lactone lactonase YvrE